MCVYVCGGLSQTCSLLNDLVWFYMSTFLQDYILFKCQWIQMIKKSENVTTLSIIIEDATLKALYLIWYWSIWCYYHSNGDFRFYYMPSWITTCLKLVSCYLHTLNWYHFSNIQTETLCVGWWNTQLQLNQRKEQPRLPTKLRKCAILSEQYSEVRC